jgi:hypothetical protein
MVRRLVVVMSGRMVVRCRHHVMFHRRMLVLFGHGVFSRKGKVAASPECAAAVRW